MSIAGLNTARRVLLTEAPALALVIDWALVDLVVAIPLKRNAITVAAEERRECMVDQRFVLGACAVRESNADFGHVGGGRPSHR